MAYSALPRIEGAVHGVNYGFDKVRFIHPVRSGSRVRGHFTLAAATLRSAREWQLSYEVSVEIEGVQKPALAAIWLTMQVMGVEDRARDPSSAPACHCKAGLRRV